MINSAIAHSQIISSHTDDLGEVSVMFWPQELTDRILVWPQEPRGRFGHHDDRRPGSAFLFGKPSAAHDREANRIEVVWRNFFVPGVYSTDWRLIFKGYPGGAC